MECHNCGTEIKAQFSQTIYQDGAIKKILQICLPDTKMIEDLDPGQMCFVESECAIYFRPKEGVLMKFQGELFNPQKEKKCNFSFC